MIDIRPVANTIGKLVVTLGAAMSLPMLVDYAHDDPNWKSFLESGILCAVIGSLIVFATRSNEKSLNLQQAFLLTNGLWIVLPLFGALPFFLGAPHVGFTDAFFESMSGLSTTGTTAFPSLDTLPKGTHLWRGQLQWLGGLGIIVVAMIFLPVMKVGGMQFFRSEGFDTLGKILPRAFDIARETTLVYVFITVACAVTFIMLGMNGFDAVFHALTTCSTGGFSNYDASFGAYPGAPQLAASFFTILAALPFIRMVQLVRGDAMPLFEDVQVRAFLRWLFYAIAVIVLYRLVWLGAENPFHVMRETVFNVVTLTAGSGFGTGDVTQWGSFPFAILIMMGMIGGCTGSTTCSIKVFRYLVLFKAVRAQIRRMHSPHRVFPVMLEGRPLDREVVGSVMAYFTTFMLSFGLLIVALALTGLHPRTALTGAWATIANIGPIWGPEVSANGAVDQFPTASKWLMVIGMFLGRLEVLSVLVVLHPRFWRQ
ncbi:TrkH family potassium uptake protein [Paracoccus aminophilus]|uniref:Trk system potassium uptake protein n=1 Tax=Paracoccus aminophilus JCM 7686 TaxID=1367847 RepID=S5Y1S6_PARAH|nr:TrkH family potassium uptake protein [Paracoccus aminophilus]AGT09675.1 cation transporter [Paracoccus aminophilus JCM 7686]